MENRTIRVSYEYHIEYETKEGCKYLLELVKEKPIHGLGGDGIDTGSYSIKLEKNSGKLDSEVMG